IILEQPAVAALTLPDRAGILDTGRVGYDDSAQKVLDDEALRAQYLAI
ncbi:MAG: ABC transporter ATP-binding protein, partial [Boseongicola sp.]|nr:ABC transporter ATP-binding protein [Boseongicola sp.]